VQHQSFGSAANFTRAAIQWAKIGQSQTTISLRIGSRIKSRTFPPFAALAHFLLRRRRIWQEGGGMQSFAAREKKYVGSEIADIHQQFER